MSVNLEHRPLSVPEFLGGGMALATVALIAFGALRFAPSHNSPPAPANYAPVSIDSSEASIKSLVEQPKVLSDAAPAHDVQSPDIPSATGSPTPTPSNEANAPEPPAADRSVAATAEPRNGAPIQQHGIETGSPGAVADVAWGPPLPNPSADSRPATGQRRNVADPPSPRADPSFIGGWADDIGRCRTGRRRHSSSTPARRRRPTANVHSGPSRARLQIGGGSRPYAPPEGSSGEPISR
jgi:hypothetical protein